MAPGPGGCVCCSVTQRALSSAVRMMDSLECRFPGLDMGAMLGLSTVVVLAGGESTHGRYCARTRHRCFLFFSFSLFDDLFPP